ncbi:MAG: hypothetical protein WB493_13135 [Anaeromyxobacteraceae bacterium]
MTKTIVAALLGALPTWTFATSWVNVPLLDATCAETAKVEPDGHPRDCLLQCAASGFGILDHGTWIPLDQVGDEKALAALRATSREDHIRVNVTGERDGAIIRVTALTIAE